MLISFVKEFDIKKFNDRCREKEAQGYEAVNPFVIKHKYNKNFKTDSYGHKFAGTDEQAYYYIVYKKSDRKS